jgi:hypothetical protein
VTFEVLKVVAIKTVVFEDVTPCSLVDVNRSFGGIHCLQLQGFSIRQASIQQDINSKLDEFLVTLTVRF